MIQFDEHIFQMGWFNDQLVILHNLLGDMDLYGSLILVYYSNALILHGLTVLTGPLCRVILLLSMYYYIYTCIYIYIPPYSHFLPLMRDF